MLISKLKKINKLSNKKVQLILTNKPQLICVDPAKMVNKGNISWSDDPSELNVQVANSSHFRICTVSPLFLLALSIILNALFYLILDALIIMPNLVLLQPKKVFVLEDAKQRAWQWKNAIEDLQHSQKN